MARIFAVMLATGLLGACEKGGPSQGVGALEAVSSGESRLRSQVTSRLDPSRHTIRTTPARMKLRGDPLLGVLSERVDVESLLTSLADRLEN